MPKRITIQRDSSFDAFRGIAIIAVVAIHAANSGLTWYGHGDKEWNYYLTLIIKQCNCFAVPSFFFISGYFIAQKADMLERWNFNFLKDRLLRILIPYITWSCAVIFILQRNFDLPFFVNTLFLGQALGPYYFIITLSCLILLSPLLFRLRNTPSVLFAVLLINCTSLIVIYYFRFTLGEDFPWWKAFLPFTTWIFFYYWGMLFRLNKMSHLFANSTSRTIPLLIVSCMLILAIIESFFLASVYGKESGADSAVKFSSFLYSASFISFFILNKKYIHTFPACLITIGKYSFGIYLIHELFRGQISSLLSSCSLFNYQPIFQFIVVALTLSSCLLFITLVNRILSQAFSTKYLGF